MGAKGTEAVIEPTVEEAIKEYFLMPQSIIYTALSIVATVVVYRYSKQYGEKYAIVYTTVRPCTPYSYALSPRSRHESPEP